LPGSTSTTPRFASTRIASRGRPADLHLGSERTLRGQAVSLPQVAGLDGVGDLLDRVLERPAR
jgi:hypothetical protein